MYVNKNNGEFISDVKKPGILQYIVVQVESNYSWGTITELEFYNELDEKLEYVGGRFADGNATGGAYDQWDEINSLAHVGYGITWSYRGLTDGNKTYISNVTGANSTAGWHYTGNAEFLCLFTEMVNPVKCIIYVSGAESRHVRTVKFYARNGNIKPTLNINNPCKNNPEFYKIFEFIDIPLISSTETRSYECLKLS